MWLSLPSLEHSAHTRTHTLRHRILCARLKMIETEFYAHSDSIDFRTAATTAQRAQSTNNWSQYIKCAVSPLFHFSRSHCGALGAFGRCAISWPWPQLYAHSDFLHF